MVVIHYEAALYQVYAPLGPTLSHLLGAGKGHSARLIGEPHHFVIRPPRREARVVMYDYRNVRWVQVKW